MDAGGRIKTLDRGGWRWCKRGLCGVVVVVCGDEERKTVGAPERGPPMLDKKPGIRAFLGLATERPHSFLGAKHPAGEEHPAATRCGSTWKRGRQTLHIAVCGQEARKTPVSCLHLHRLLPRYTLAVKVETCSNPRLPRLGTAPGRRSLLPVPHCQQRRKGGGV